MTMAAAVRLTTTASKLRPLAFSRSSAEPMATRTAPATSAPDDILLRGSGSVPPIVMPAQPDPAIASTSRRTAPSPTSKAPRLVGLAPSMAAGSTRWILANLPDGGRDSEPPLARPRTQQRLDQPPNAIVVPRKCRRPSPGRDWAGSTFVKMVALGGIEPSATPRLDRLGCPPARVPPGRLDPCVPELVQVGNGGRRSSRSPRICCLIPRVVFWVLVPHLRRGGEVVGERRVGTFLQMSRGGGEGFEFVAKGGVDLA